MSYVIAYVDGVEAERESFVTDSYLQGENNMIIKAVDPKHKPNVDQMVYHLLDLNIDALVTEYKLSEFAVVNYSGKDLLDCMLQNRPEFPCFIRTHYEKEAIQEQMDVNMVYKKPGPYFIRVMIQIENYRARINDRQNELIALMKIDPDKRTDGQIDQILELDYFLEKSLGGAYAIPKNLKRDIFVGKRMKLIEEAEQLIKEIRHQLDGS